MFFTLLLINLPPKGSFPDYWGKYNASIDTKTNTFKCFDGLKSIDLSKFNNNYPDCSDASDEPGTSANFHDKFYCQNSESLPIIIDRWSVGDGICDCCDGSDEFFNPKIQCPNTCPAEGKARNKIITKITTIYNSALPIRQNMTEKGETIFEESKSQIEKLEEELSSLTEIKEKIEQEAEDKLNAEMEANNPDQSLNSDSANSDEENDSNQPNSFHSNEGSPEEFADEQEINDQFNSESQNDHNIESNQNDENIETEKNVENEKNENFEYVNYQNEINQKYDEYDADEDPNYESSSDYQHDDYPIDDYYRDDRGYEYNPDLDRYSYEEYDGTEDFNELKGWKKIIVDIWKFTFRVTHKNKHQRRVSYHPDNFDYDPSDYSPPDDYSHDVHDYSYTETRFDEETNNKLNDLNENITNLENQKEKAEKSLKMENVSRAYLALYNEEYSFEEYKFIFMNEFKKSYDSYGKFVEMRNGAMIMENGDYCWENEAHKKTEIVFVCSNQNKLAKVIETGTCQYKAWFTTPAACTEGTIDEMNNMTLTQLESTYELIKSSQEGEI